MSAVKTIQNPEIPGMERMLPPPPPPPPPPPHETPQARNVTDPAVVVPNIQAPMTPIPNMVHNSVPSPMPMAAPIAYPTTPASAPYYPVVPAQPPPPTSTSWWMGTEEDAYQSWYEARYKAALAAQSEGTKTKTRSFKRKAEIVDPKLDAEKVANAQRELSALMKPLKCDLCNAVMNSTLQAKLHYQGKPHQKKVSMFLNQSAKKVKTEDGQVSSTTSNDWNSYCEICKTWFTSQIDAAQHYAGKKHMKAAHGVNKSRPSKKNQNSAVPVDPTGRFGIGVSFIQERPPAVPIPAAVPEVPQQQPVAAVVPNVTYPTPTTYGAALRCDLCGVSTNRLDQLEIHKRGARHLRMLKLNGMPLPESNAEKEVMPTVSGPIDYSIYRTPSGQYYCAPCNLSLNSESTFAQHIESKKHKNQTNPKAQSGTATAAKKTTLKKK